MHDLKVTLIQTDLVWEDVESNLAGFGDKIDGIQGNTHLIVLPEMFTTGFSLDADHLAQDMKGSAIQWMQKKSMQKNVDIVGSIIVKENGKYYNRLLWAKPKGTLFTYDKKHLFRIIGEEKVYSAGDKNITVELNGWKIRPFICYDLRFPVWTRNVDNQFDLAIFIANWPENRSSHWKTLLQARAIENQCYVIGVNRVGTDGNGLYHSGDSSIIDPLGTVIFKKSDHSCVYTADLSCYELQEHRKSFPVWRDADKEVRRTTSILEAMEDGIYIVNNDYTMDFMNKAMVDLFGEGTGKKCYQVINRNDEICPWCKAKEVFEGETIHQEVYMPAVDKSYYLTELPLRNTDGTVSKLSIYRDITLSKKREEKLKSSEEDYKRLFEHVGCGVYISSKEGKFLDANQALLDMLGYKSKDEFLKIDITKDLYLKPEDRRKFQEMIEKEGRVIDYEVDFRRKDGIAISVLLTAHVRHDQQGKIVGYEGINVDQSQRKQMEKAVRDANDFLNKTIQSSPNAIMAADLKGNIIIWNRAAEEILGYKAIDVIGKMNIEKVYAEGEARKVMQMMRSLQYGGVGILRSYPMVYVRQDGGVVEGNLSAAIMYGEEEKEVASVGVFVDLVETLKMERKLRQTQEQLLQSEKLAAMGRLTSQVAHELNNPLYGIMNTLELMKTEIPVQNKRRKVLDMALSETVRLTELLRKMLSFSKPDQEEKQSIDINTILGDIILLHEKQFMEHSIRISSFFAKDLGEVHASKNQLRQVFLNIISNARDAMPEGGTMSVRTKLEHDNVHIKISDTGIGIEKENLNKIFDAFFTTKDSVKDVGLGLSVCYGFVKDHGGDIKVKSKLGSGTTFTIIFPVYKETPEDKKAPS